jgi:CheY-like chemotaxis protein
MNAIIGMGELLQYEHLNERQKSYVSDIVVSANALLGIINDILDFSKIEAGKLELNPVDYDFKAFLDNIKSMFSYVAQKKKLEFMLETEGDIPGYLYGDDLRLRQTLTNIISNAIKFTETGYVCLKIYVQNDSLLFEVKDTGIGIRKEDVGKLFNAFAQVDKTKNRHVVGTGLGLTISKTFVEMMGGQITFVSEYMHGTTFTIRIPVVLGNKDLAKSENTCRGEQSITAPDARVLVIDDNGFNLKVAYGLLDLMMIQPDTADSGYVALGLIASNDYDVVFVDHMMPEMDGLETAKRIREMGGKYASMPLIALTANAIHGAREMYLKNGFNDFLSKPIDTHELVRILKKWLPEQKINFTDGQTAAEPSVTAAKMDDLHNKSVLTFYKENKLTSIRLTDAIRNNDIVTAHRIAHTIKSNAAYLKKPKLAEAAAQLEDAFKDGEATQTPQQLAAFEKELNAVLTEYEEIVRQAEPEQPKTQLDGERLAAIFGELRPLLVNNDFGAAHYADLLRNVTGMAELAEMIDEYNFDGALNILDELHA